MTQHAETIQRFDLSVEGRNLIVYVSDIAVRITERSSPIERDLVIVQGGGALGTDAQVSFIGTSDSDANQRSAAAARSAARTVLTVSGLTPKQTRFLRLAETMPNPS